MPGAAEGPLRDVPVPRVADRAYDQPTAALPVILKLGMFLLVSAAAIFRQNVRDVGTARLLHLKVDDLVRHEHRLPQVRPRARGVAPTENYCLECPLSTHCGH